MSELPTFNLWSESWITVEATTGAVETVSIAELLNKAPSYRTLMDPSPLVMVAIHRLMVAILQDALRPANNHALLNLWEAGSFPSDALEAFGGEYAHRFDLFSDDAPFLQSADIARDPEKKGQGKSVGYLLAEQTAGTAVTHYHHLYEDGQMLCAVCCAGGLLTIPPFASSGGAGIRPSINGVPPIYILPGGETLFHSLVASLTTPHYQPDIADQDNDTPWWRHDPVVGKSAEVLRVGYLHSLTFPARRVRLHPEPMARPCSRCGRSTTWGVAEMVYQMGESRPKNAPFWQDPFAAYYTRKDSPAPLPIRPREGHALWREFAALFLPQDSAQTSSRIRPSIIDQLETLHDGLPIDPTSRFPFRAVGLRTDMKMKIFEWESSGFQITPRLLADPAVSLRIEHALEFAEQAAATLKRMYRLYFSGSGTRADAFGSPHVKGSNALRDQMLTRYWQRLGEVFLGWISRFWMGTDADDLLAEWTMSVVETCAIVFRDTTQHLYSGDSTALAIEQANSHCRNALYADRNKLIPKEATP